MPCPRLRVEKGVLFVVESPHISHCGIPALSFGVFSPGRNSGHTLSTVGHCVLGVQHQHQHQQEKNLLVSPGSAPAFLCHARRE